MRVRALWAGVIAVIVLMMVATPAAGVETEQKLSFPVAADRDPDTNATTIGTKFTVARAGKVIGVEFFRHDRRNRATTVQLWGIGGTPLASASGVPLTNGWVRANFRTPVAVSPGITYIASYFAPSGRYSHRLHGFVEARAAGDLIASVGAGVYRYGSTAAKPTSLYQHEDYYVTPLFVPDTPTATTTSPPPAAAAACGDRLDRGTDRKIGSMTDPGCSSSTDTNETNSAATPPPPPTGTFPNPSTTGVPLGWTPTQTRTTDLRITTAGAVVQDMRLVNANLIVDAPNVTIRRVEVQGGYIDNLPGDACRNGMLLEDVSVIRAPGQVTSGDRPTLGIGGYTARRVKIDGVPEGFRVGGTTSPYDCGPVTIENSFARVQSPDQCGDWHGDAIQGYDGAALTVRNVTVELVERPGCGGTAPFFYPANQDNTSVNIDGLLVKGGGISFRLGMPGAVRGLKIANDSWTFGPIDVMCSTVPSWQADIVTIDANYRPTTTVRAQPCDTESGT